MTGLLTAIFDDETFELVRVTPVPPRAPTGDAAGTSAQAADHGDAAGTSAQAADPPDVTEEDIESLQAGVRPPEPALAVRKKRAPPKNAWADITSEGGDT
eukprot:9331120-Heterocapsa_arctica.AAC.1